MYWHYIRLLISLFSWSDAQKWHMFAVSFQLGICNRDSQSLLEDFTRRCCIDVRTSNASKTEVKEIEQNILTRACMFSIFISVSSLFFIKDLICSLRVWEWGIFFLCFLKRFVSRWYGDCLGELRIFLRTRNLHSPSFFTVCMRLFIANKWLR